MTVFKGQQWDWISTLTMDISVTTMWRMDWKKARLEEVKPVEVGGGWGGVLLEARRHSGGCEYGDEDGEKWADTF